MPSWSAFLILPIGGAILAWFVQSLALWLLFNPQEFKGVRVPWFRKMGLHQLGLEGFGWQGLVPHQKGVMAEIAVRLMTHKLLPLDEMIRRIPTVGLSDRLTPPMQETADSACRIVMQRHKPSLWESLPAFVQNSVIFRIRSIVPSVCRQILEDLQKKPAYYLSVKTLVVEVVTARPYVVVDLFKNAGKDPMKYLVRFATVSGLLVGFLLACIEYYGLSYLWVVAVSVLTAGVLQKLAIESLFFHPEHGAIRIGGFTGFFFRDQNHIAELFSHTAAREVLTTENIVLALCRGPNSKNLENLIEHHVHRAMDQQSGNIKPLLVSMIGAEEWRSIKEDAARIFSKKLEQHLLAAKVYLGDALRIEEVVKQRLSELPPLEFEKALRPVFSRFEWMMPFLGGIWGAALAALFYVL